MGSHKMVRSLERGLDVLAALNRHNGAPVSTISEAVDLHRTTVYRLLETLRDAGYVRKSDSDNSYRLTLKARSLSDGFDEEAWVTDLGAPVLGWLLRQVSWPSVLATFSAGGMVIRESTHRFSPLSVHQAMVGVSLPILTSAVGRSYLAFCTEQERCLILERLVTEDSPGAYLLHQPGALDRLLNEARDNGYTTSQGEIESKITAIAVPIMFGPRVFACINVVMFGSAMPLSEAVELYVPNLRQAAKRIEAGLDREGRVVDAPVMAGARPEVPAGA